MTEKKIRVGVLGARGRLGAAAVEAITATADLELVAALGRDDALADLIEASVEVVLDVSVPEASEANVRFAVEHDIHAVVGTSGWAPEKRHALSGVLSQHPQTGVLIAPNFAIGSVLASHFAAQAARYFDSVEIIELHHPRKIDAPSGTAMRTAEAIAEARSGMPAAPDATQSALDGARGAQVAGVPVHSVRLAGLTAHQEVLFGSPGEQLSLRHDSFGHSSFMPGVLLGLRNVSQRPGLSYGLESYLGLSASADKLTDNLKDNSRDASGTYSDGTGAVEGRD